MPNVITMGSKRFATMTEAIVFKVMRLGVILFGTIYAMNEATVLKLIKAGAVIIR